MRNGKYGAGVIAVSEGFRHIEAYQANPRTELIAICDPDPVRLTQRKEKYNVPIAVSDYRELLNMPEIDVVSVTSPDYYHAEQAVACMESGRHVLCEKPMTLSMEDCKKIIKAVDETGKIFLTGHPTRFTPAFMTAKRLYQQGYIGELFMIESEYAHNYARTMGKDSWRKDARRDPLLGGGCHAVDLMRWIGGDAEEAFAYGNHKCLTDWPLACDNYMTVYKLKNNVIGKVMCSIGLVRPYTMRTVIYGTEGTIVCDNMSDTLQIASRKLSDEFHPQFTTMPVKVDNHNVVGEVSDLIAAVADGAPLKADVREGTRTVATCIAAIESAKTGRPVKVDYNY